MYAAVLLIFFMPFLVFGKSVWYCSLPLKDFQSFYCNVALDFCDSNYLTSQVSQEINECMSLFSAALTFSQLFAGNLIPIKKMNWVVCFNSLKMLIEIGSANVQNQKKKKKVGKDKTHLLSILQTEGCGHYH